MNKEKDDQKKGTKMERVSHDFGPVYDKNSKVLILGTVPSVQSRKVGFYYANPKNRFWHILFDLFNEKYLLDIESRKQFLYDHQIALWDVLSECDIQNSSDSSIRNPKVNDISKVIKNSKIKTIFTTGKKATELYTRYCYPTTKIPCIYLPSTSSANCAIGYEDLKTEYEKILNYL